MDSTSKVPAVILAALQAQNIDPSKCNLMLPTQTYGEVLGMFDKITFESIKVNPDPTGKEVYEPDGPGKGKALGKVPLQKIAMALGIIWDPATTGIVEDTDSKSRAKATGAIRKPNGEPVIISEEKTINAKVLGERDRLSIEERAEKGNPEKVKKWGKTESGKSFPEEFAPWKDDAERERWIDRAVRKAVIQHQLTKNEKANTGAKERVIRAFIAMKSTYTNDELALPFVYPCVSIDSAKMLANPDVRAMAVERLSRSIQSLFGPGRGREVIDISPARQLESQPVPRTYDENGEREEPTAQGEGQLAFPEAEGEQTELSPEDRAREILVGYKAKIGADVVGNAAKGKTIHQLIDAMVANKKATLADLNAAINFCEGRANGGAA